jgi:NAD kinase
LESRDAPTWASRTTPRWMWKPSARSATLALVVGGDGTMLGIGRQLARYGVPLIGINQGRLGFITDIPLDGFRAPCADTRCCRAPTKKTTAA